MISPLDDYRMLAEMHNTRASLTAALHVRGCRLAHRLPLHPRHVKQGDSYGRNDMLVLLSIESRQSNGRVRASTCDLALFLRRLSE